MNIVVIILGKASSWLLRKFGRNGSALPGLIVEKLHPKLLEHQLDQLEHGVIVVTGTNGKTTTTKSLVFLLQQCGYRVFTNPTGSNFTRGVYSSLIRYSSFGARLDYDIAVLELDEAYSRVFAERYPPRLVLALNVMRDQLDRYGEIDKTAQMIGDTISHATDGAVLNFDDPRVRDLAQRTSSRVTYFGASDDLKSQLPSDDDLHASHNNKHHKHKRSKDGSSNSVILSQYKPGYVGFRVQGKFYSTQVQIAGIHNAFNLTAALATALRVCDDMEVQFIVPAMKEIPAAFGRGEVIRLTDDLSITLALVKNPSGFRQSIRSYDTSQYALVAFVINDDFADGRDVSWLWDVDFTDIDKDNVRVAAGSRAGDMVLRLKYDEISCKNVGNEFDLMQYINSQPDRYGEILIFCTYTAMTNIRSGLEKTANIKGIWGHE